MKNKTLHILILVLLHSCRNQENQLEDIGFLKYSHGNYIGDFIDFKNPIFKLKNDTIFKNNIPYIYIVKVEYRIISGDKLLYIKYINTNKIGVYVEK